MEINSKPVNDLTKNMVESILQVTLESYNVNTNIRAKEVVKVLDRDQLNIFQDSVEKQLIKSYEKRRIASLTDTEPLDNGLSLDLGHYPLSPWLNKANNIG